MNPKKSKSEALALFTFLVATIVILTNGFTGRIFAEEKGAEVFTKIEPIGDVLYEILQNYVYEPDLDKAVEGALIGIMDSLDENSGFMPPESFTSMRQDTEGSFEGIGIKIQRDDDGNIYVFQPIPGAPAMKAGIRAGDIIVSVDGVPAHGITTEEAANMIKGPRGQSVHLTIKRKDLKTEVYETLEFDVKRGKIPLESIHEARILDGNIGYIRISDFKKNSAEDIRKQLETFLAQGMTSLVLDLRWNPGGLLTSAREVSELFLPKNSLVTYTRGRAKPDGGFAEDMKLYTERKPVLPETMPMILLVSNRSASSSEIVTGALQFYKRAIVVGERTYGKGSVQTIIPLRRPEGSALRLTTALYYTPANITIDRAGILPDVEVPMDIETQALLIRQLYESEAVGPEFVNRQNHGAVTGNQTGEGEHELVHDTVLAKAVEILKEDSIWENLVKKYHRDVKETQVAATGEAEAKPRPEPAIVD